MKLSLYKVPYHYYWLALILFCNIWSASYTASTGLMMGDLKGRVFDRPDLLLVSFICIAAIHLFFMVFCFQSANRLKLVYLVKPVQRESVDVGTFFNLLMTGLNILFIIFCLNNDANMAGRESEVSSPFKYFWIFFPPDLIFILSCAHYSHSKYFKANFLTYAASSIIRGWSGVLLLLIFIGGYLLYSKRKLTLSKVVMAVIGVATLYPFILTAKWVIRGGEGDFVAAFISSLADSNILELYLLSIQQIVGRLELTGLFAHTLAHGEMLREGFDAGMFAPFWYEGLFGNIYQVLVNGGRALEMGTWVLGTEMFDHSNRVVGHSVTNLSFFSWFVIAPLHSVFYFIYLSFLFFFIVYFNRMNGDTGLSRAIIWFFLLGALFPPWISSLVGMAYCCIVFLVLRFVIQKLVKIKFRWKSGESQKIEFLERLK
ncbi:MULTISPECIES: oligosaccharide repeat unit polymerase [unclassified Marinobacterium]|uniref:oligosaccharide repeat unit polymerase n=1 Tax=unclassified Marinobacterium TaxID=2644139 RepID=UPI0015691F68|nr:MULTISPECIES: oligosaccharide repeat unit polymerase [unclassified Marinobacterium]NRP53635.1 hypothetical protein [Marinobacterium sp. xm-v-242]NRP77885.1 hypothetical protein [Marinobacterium sp. xm-m-383]